MIPIPDERALASIALALVGERAGVSVRQRRLGIKNFELEPEQLDHIQAKIMAGGDPLGDAFSRLRSPDERRDQGATYTPAAIVDAMISWAKSEDTPPARIVDPGAGSGRFTMAAARAFPDAKIIAIETDPLAALLCQANAAVLGITDRLTIRVADYRSITLPPINGPTLYIGNPPYVRHHDIPEEWKSWFGATAAALGFSASKLAGLHIHFFLKTRELAKPGDFGAFITAAEWIDVNYGSVLRRMLADGLGGASLHVLDAKSKPFADALTTGAITCFRIGGRGDALGVSHVDRLADLDLTRSRAAIPWTVLEDAPRWSHFLRNSTRAAHGMMELGELFRVSRGQVTGANDVWIAGPEAEAIPARFLFPTITKAKELISAGPVLKKPERLKRVVDLPANLEELDGAELKAVKRFLAWAKRSGAADSYVAKHRRAWWSVSLYEPPPILATYMARRPPTFVRNACKARHLNVAHGLYPREPMGAAALDAVCRFLNENTGLEGGRTYAGGLVKFEPREMERLHIPRPELFGAGVSA